MITVRCPGGDGWELGTLNLGPVKAFHIMRKRYGGFENVGATVDDCKNFRKRINSYIGEYDADMVINRMTDKKQYLADYSFEYSVDDGKRLTGLFWANGLCKLNYMEFGDVISFDATFKTNRYKMVFVLFTCIDNHCRNVTLSAGLLASESIESYKWLLNSFLKSFGRQPNVVVTDQDPAMKQAIEEVFPISRHRLCMWHIMKKVADKVGHELCNNDEFKRRMCDIVWTDSIEPEEFERQWKLVMIEFGLTENKWIDDMFGMRSMWIPAFYRHEPMSGLMRTTSRSESENHFFCQVANSQLTLVEFMNHFDGAMDVQRFNHRKNDHISRYTEPADWSQTTLEKDAAKIYTRILLKDFKAHGDGLLEVWFKNLENDVTAQCSCLRFEQYGLLCKHIYFLFKMFGVKEIPNKYVMKRWTKDVVPNELNVKYNLNVGGKDVHQRAKRIAREIIHTGEYLVSNLISDFDQLVLVRDQMMQLKERVDQSRITKQLDPKFDRFSKLIGYQQPVTNAPPTVRVPAGIRNKGHGSHRRIKSRKEQMISRKGKRSRTCSVCNEKGHDIRTCGELKAKQQGKQGKKKMKGVQIEDGVRDKDNEGEDDEEEDDFEDYISDDGSEEEDQ
ncbi:putative transcription factor interactor and regulator CCHC(Zn) family [Helianthus annuus]|uniref:Transcription factor interactor and regulator CCHC(Zn) family n=1 Tax=Helianthus annuus TaxID=4232 RepID=A0A9K3DYZ1_HELAN|nr:putative transcription factor interactor and regulator CCHC(Zn) family [Helianthus annuus]